MTGHMNGSVPSDDSERPGRGSRTPPARARSSSSGVVPAHDAPLARAVPDEL